MRTPASLPVLLIALAACNDLKLGGNNLGLAPDGFDPDEILGMCSVVEGRRTIDTLPTCGAYELGSFTPAIEWEAGRNQAMRSQPIVADLDGDGMPEIIANITPVLLGGRGSLRVFEGDGSSEHCRNDNARLGYAAAPAVGDLDGDGSPEIVAVRALGDQVGTTRVARTDYRVVAFDAQCNELWESKAYDRTHFDYATAVIVSDMDGDGAAEIVAGRVILRADGTERGMGPHGIGSWGQLPGIPAPLGDGVPVSEASVPAVADLDLDGVEEVIVGNAMYSPDGEVLWWAGPSALLNPAIARMDGMVGVANLDDDPEGEFVVVSYATLRAHDTDGTLLWGPFQLDPSQGATDEESGNIAAPPAIADIDNDGRPEIVTAAGNELSAFNHDGTRLWSQGVQDLTGATGAAIFDFEGDGPQEVVYIDEINVYAFDGPTGRIKFLSDRHGSETMMDYPTIADVDADGSAEIIVAHSFLQAAFTVYGAADGRWAPARPVWNQHAYAISNIADDLSLPGPATPGFTIHNTWHAATDRALFDVEERYDLQVKLLDPCDVECDLGRLWVFAQPLNRTPVAVPSGVGVTLYSVRNGVETALSTLYTEEPIPAGNEGPILVFQIDAGRARRAERLIARVDAANAFPECVEDDNGDGVRGPFCTED